MARGKFLPIGLNSICNPSPPALVYGPKSAFRGTIAGQEARHADQRDNRQAPPGPRPRARRRMLSCSWTAPGSPSAVGRAGALAGIGFTMSLFIAGQAFPSATDFSAAKIAVFAASILSAVFGTVLLWGASRQELIEEAPQSAPMQVS